ncbi:hypothetical protein ABEW81_11290 [Priestia megaterium]
MPKPPMNDNITVFEPGEKNKYGQPTGYTEKPSKARVSYTTKTVEENDGTRFEPTLEVNLPPSTKIGYGFLIQWTDRFGSVVKDAVTGLEEQLSYNGKQVYYRTVYVGKKRVL